MASGFLVLISFFTRIPIGKKVKYDDKTLIEALSIFSLLGAIIGILLYFADMFCYALKIEKLRGLILTFTYILTTGGIHLDGAADTSDGLFSGRTKEKVFEIMNDPHIGSFGVMCLVIIILSQYVLFTYLDRFALIVVPVIGKAAIIAGAVNKKYAKKTKGMGTIFVESIDNKIVILNVLILIILCLLLPIRIKLIIASLLTLIAACFISKWIENKIGGMTGDTCGFINEISQIIFMFVFLMLEGI